MKPADGPFNHPSINAQAAAMFGISSCQNRSDATLSQGPAMGLRIVRSISLHVARTLAWPAALAAHRWDGVDQRKKLSHIVSVGARYRGRQRNAARIGNQM